jgi:hypothetical protein
MNSSQMEHLVQLDQKIKSLVKMAIGFLVKCQVVQTKMTFYLCT